MAMPETPNRVSPAGGQRDTDDRISPAGERQRNAARNPQPSPSKPKPLQPDDGSVDYTAEDERRFYENYLERVRRRNQEL